MKRKTPRRLALSKLTLRQLQDVTAARKQYTTSCVNTNCPQPGK